MKVVNNIKGTTKAFGDVPAALGTLIDLGTTYTYNTLMVISNLDTDVVIKIGSNEITFPANKNVTIEDAMFNDLIQYKYSSAPSSGSLSIMCF